jgi:hypothetical protein
MAQLGVWAKVWAVTDMPDELLQKINVEPYHDVQKTLDAAIDYVQEMGEEPKIVILPSGSLTVPVLEGTEISGGWMRVRTDIGVSDILDRLDLVLEN